MDSTSVYAFQGKMEGGVNILEFFPNFVLLYNSGS